MLHVYLTALTGIMLAQISPGPNLLAVAGAALGQGLRAALCVTFGVATAIFVWVSVTTFGQSTVLALYPPVLIGLKLIGGAYLCLLAVRAVRAALSGTRLIVHADRSGWTAFGLWRRGVLVNLTNPKSALMWMAFTTFMFGSGLSTAQVLAFAPMGFASAMMVYGLYAVLFSTALARRLYARWAAGVQGVFGLAFGALGGRLITDGLRDLAQR